MFAPGFLEKESMHRALFGKVKLTHIEKSFFFRNFEKLSWSLDGSLIYVNYKEISRKNDLGFGYISEWGRDFEKL